MLISGTGVDIIEIGRIKAAVDRKSFISRVFHDNEIAYCESRKAHSFASYAARFAAKEAVLKAFGTGLRSGNLTDIEIYNDAFGCPKVRLHGYFKEWAATNGIADIYISLSHSREYAIAQAICWRS